MLKCEVELKFSLVSILWSWILVIWPLPELFLKLLKLSDFGHDKLLLLRRFSTLDHDEGLDSFSKG